ncbi:MAG: vanadium-dependent haloperoxidase, partial [Chitinophagaceae bacterium]
VHDVTNPPLAARFFAYTSIAGYETLSLSGSNLVPLKDCLNQFPDIPVPDSVKSYNAELAAIMAMLHTAQKLQPSGSLLVSYESRFIDSCREIGFSEDIITGSLRFADQVSKAVLAYARADNYNKTTTYRRFEPSTQPGAWYPTPPAYFAAVEPYFNTVRSFTLDSASQFIPEEPVVFSERKNSAFYSLMEKNYRDSLNEDHQTIAAFWDCNPFAMQDNGHLLIGLKKISPGAHWLGITGIILKDRHTDFVKSMKILTLVSIGLMDEFICCWDEKYRSNRIRPETAIRKYIDADWMPLLQTPPFPEYPSGHSVISAASAIILTHFFGTKNSFTDTVEMRFGLPSRSFVSIDSAAREAGISRFYGGIHFMDAIENGLSQGKKVGAHVLGRFGIK